MDTQPPYYHTPTIIYPITCLIILFLLIHHHTPYFTVEKVEEGVKEEMDVRCIIDCEVGFKIMYLSYMSLPMYLVEWRCSPQSWHSVTGILDSRKSSLLSLLISDQFACRTPEPEILSGLSLLCTTIRISLSKHISG